MKGIRMNQFVAPTSFITPTSRRREKIASLIVFKMSTAAERTASPRYEQHDWEDARTSQLFIYWPGDVTH